MCKTIELIDDNLCIQPHHYLDNVLKQSEARFAV